MSETYFNHELLAVARTLRGMSQSELAQKLGISQGHYSKLEHGIIIPDANLVGGIAEKLHFCAGFFSQRAYVLGSPMSVHPMFRKRASVSKGLLDRVVAGLNVRVLNIRELLKSVDLESGTKLPRYDVDADYGGPEEIATLVRRAWLLPTGPVRDLVHTIESSGVFIVHADMELANIDGATFSAPGIPHCIFLNRRRPADRLRFSLAHELGHLVMHAQPSDTMEDEANHFASAFLMPKREFIASCARKIDLKELARLKLIWRVSMQAALYRAKQLQLITANQASYLWKRMSQLGYRKSEPVTFAREEPKLLKDLLNLHMNDLGFNATELADALHLMPDEFHEMYRIKDHKKWRPKLRVVK